MNHAVNAIVRRLPPCPECDARLRAPCRNENGFVCAPHRVRERIRRGELFAISLDDARALRRVRVLKLMVERARRRRR